MQVPVKTTISDKIVFADTDNGPTDQDFIDAVNVHNVDNILALDKTIYDRLFPRLNELFKRGKLNKNVKYRPHHIESSISNADPARKLFYGIEGMVNANGKTMIHCKLGQDRTGFAIASYLIRAMGWEAAKAIEYVEGLTGYGNGISPQAKEKLNGILMEGRSPEDEEVDEDGDLSQEDGTQEVSTQEAQDLLSADTNDADDIVSVMRDYFSHQQGHNSAGTVDAGPFADNLRYNNFSDPTQEIYPGNEPSYSEGPAINVAASSRVKRASRKKILLKILELMTELVDEEAKGSEDKNDGFLGDVQPWDALPGSTVSPAISDVTNADDLPHQPKGIAGVGEVDNYAGVGANSFNNPSSTPGAGNAAAPVEPSGYVQL